MQGVVDTHQVCSNNTLYFPQAYPSFYFLAHVTQCVFASTVRILIRNMLILGKEKKRMEHVNQHIVDSRLSSLDIRLQDAYIVDKYRGLG